MFNNRPITAIVPARGGSKGVPGKNKLKLAGYSLLERAILLGLRSPHVDRVIVSTDDAEMHETAIALGVAAPTLRPAELAADDTRTSDVVRHLIEQADIADGWLLLLQPTSPLRVVSDLDGVLEVARRSAARSVVSVVRHDEPRPEKLQRIDDGMLRPYMGTAFEGPRQALPQPYALNGAFYLIDRDLFLETGSFLPEGTAAYVMPEARSANIDSPQDWQIVNAMISAGHWVVEDFD
jgi:N-acylneuraminate cytidylyltransferase